jgi:hypothetical protein
MNSRQQEGLGKIICGGIMIYFGLPLYIHGMPLDKIGLIFLLLGPLSTKGMEIRQLADLFLPLSE